MWRRADLYVWYRTEQKSVGRRIGITRSIGAIPMARQASGHDFSSRAVGDLWMSCLSAAEKPMANWRNLSRASLRKKLFRLLLRRHLPHARQDRYRRTELLVIGKFVFLLRNLIL